MSIDLFIPTVWSGQILNKLKKALVYASPLVVNHDYEGEIADYGNSVKIHGIGEPTITAYTKNSFGLGTPQVLDDFEAVLNINQAFSFNFGIDDIDTAQTNPKVLGTALDRASYQLANVADQYAASVIVAAAAANTDVSGEPVPTIVGTTAAPYVVGTPETDTLGNSAYEYLVDLGVQLDNQLIPRSLDRYVVVPPWFIGELSKDVRFVGYGGANGNTVLVDGFAGQGGANGYSGRAAGFNVLVSTNVPTGTGEGGAYDSIVAGTPDATTFANQIVKVEALRSQVGFTDVLRGLHVYGCASIWAERTVLSYIQQYSA